MVHYNIVNGVEQVPKEVKEERKEEEAKKKEEIKKAEIKKK